MLPEICKFLSETCYLSEEVVKKVEARSVTMKMLIDLGEDALINVELNQVVKTHISHCIAQEIKRKIPFAMTADMLPKYSGDEASTQSVEAWLEGVSRDAATFMWTEKETFVAAKRALTKSALDWYDQSLGIYCWNDLKSGLVSKFGKRENISGSKNESYEDKIKEIVKTDKNHAGGSKSKKNIGKKCDNNDQTSRQLSLEVSQTNKNYIYKPEVIKEVSLILFVGGDVIKNAVDVKIGRFKVKARLSTSAEVHVMRHDFWVKLKKVYGNKLRETIDIGYVIRDAYGEMSRPLFRVELNSEIDGNSYELEYAVMPMIHLPEEILFGLPLADVADVTWSPDKITILPKVIK